MRRLDADGCDPDPAAAMAACLEVRRAALMHEAQGFGPAHPLRHDDRAQLALCEVWRNFAPAVPLGNEDPPIPADAPIEKQAWLQIVAVAKQDGYGHEASGDAATALSKHALLEKGQRKLSLFALDFPPDDARHKTRVGRTQALFVETLPRSEAPSSARTPTDVLDAIVGRKRLGVIPANELGRVALRAGFAGEPGSSRSYSMVAGVQHARAELTDASTRIDAVLVTYLDARNERRVLVDGHRVLVVSVCDPCPTGRHTADDDPTPPDGRWDREEAARITAAIAEAAKR